MDWIEAIRVWRALPEEEKRRRRLESIPRKVARSMAFEGEPVDLKVLEAQLAQHLMRTVAGQPNAAAERLKESRMTDGANEWRGLREGGDDYK